MIIYEVSLSINNDIYHDYYTWLLAHIEKMLKLDGFKKVEISLVGHQEVEGNKSIKVSYSVESEEHLQKYFTEYASKMRAEGVAKFSDKFIAVRRIIIE